MPVRVADLSRLYKFPMGRAEFALREVERRARARNQPDIADLARLGADEAHVAMGLQVRFQPVTRAKYSSRARQWDKLVKNCLSAFGGYLDIQIRAYPTEARALAARRIMRALLPDGVLAISGLSYPEEHAAVDVAGHGRGPRAGRG